MSWVWGVWYLQISSPLRSQSFTRGSRQILAWNEFVCQLCCHLAKSGLKSPFRWKRSSRIRWSSSSGSFPRILPLVGTHIGWQMSDDTLEIEDFQGRAVRWRYLCLVIFLSSSNLSCSPNKRRLNMNLKKQVWGLLCSPSVIRMVALHYVVILGLFDHLHLGKEFWKGDWIDRARDITLIKQDT